MEKYKEIYDYLVAHNIKPSMQRIAVMKCLRSDRVHFSVEDIYNKVKSECPTLSKTTVYNTLKLFVEHGAATMLLLDESRTCFDGFVEPHAHFFCTQCRKIFDVPLSNNNLQDNNNMPTGFSIDGVAVSYRGKCPECNKKHS